MMVDEEETSRFWWLWHNKLYASTPLTGYGFINAAKRLVEVVAWYGVLLLFFAFTANNALNLVNRYNSQPTKTEVFIASNATEANIKNFTLKLKLPIAEMFDSTVRWVVNSIKAPFLCDSSHLTGEFMAAPLTASHCLLISLYPLVKNYDPVSSAYTRALVKWSGDQFHCKTQVTQLNQTITSIVETEKVLKKLESLYGQKLTAAWAKIFEESFWDGFSAFNDYQRNDEREGPLHFPLYLLLSAMSELESQLNNLPFLSQINTTKFFQTAGLSPNDAIDTVRKSLLDIAPLKLPEELNATRVVLRKWQLEFRDKNITHEDGTFIWDAEDWANLWGPESEPQIEIPEIFRAGYNLFEESFMQEYLILLPDGVKEFSLDIFPPKQLIEALFVVMHYDKYIYEIGNWAYMPWSGEDLDSFLEIFQKLIDCDPGPFDSEQSTANYNHYIYDKPRKRYLESFFDPLLDFYSSHSELQLDTGSGYITMEPFGAYKVKYLPIGRIISQTDNCTSMDLTECVELCQSNYSISNCHCVPWTMQYLWENLDIQICHKPCPGSKANSFNCVEECESRLAHPCDRFMYRPEIIAQKSTRKSLEENSPISRYSGQYKQALTNDLKLFTLKIDIEQVFTYSKTKETYEMSFTTFISEFGGLVDFWLGVNIIGILHAILYIFKQFFHCGKTHKTGRTVRRLFGQDKIDQANVYGHKQVLEEIQKNKFNNASADCAIHIQKLQNTVELIQIINEKRHAETDKLLAKIDKKVGELELKIEGNVQKETSAQNLTFRNRSMTTT